MIKSKSGSLRLLDVTKTYVQANGSNTVLDNVTASFEKSRTYALTGVSGTGKSTIIHLLAGLDNPSSGEVYFNDVLISSLSKIEKQNFLNKSIGLIFQFPYLVKELSIIDNIIIKDLINLKKSDIMLDRAYELLRLIGLEHRAKDNPVNLSGGEAQRVAIARALFNSPDFLLADEPTAHLDEKTRDAILDLLLDCQSKWNMGLIIASHDIAVANRMSTKFELKNKKLEEISF